MILSPKSDPPSYIKDATHSLRPRPSLSAYTTPSFIKRETESDPINHGFIPCPPLQACFHKLLSSHNNGGRPRTPSSTFRGFQPWVLRAVRPVPNSPTRWHCAGSITPLGYKCQEFEVRYSIFFTFFQKKSGEKLENKCIKIQIIAYDKITTPNVKNI